MSLEYIDHFLKSTKIWILFTILILGYYLSPLFHSTFYVPTYDNLDSNVIWYKILADSGKTLADNHSIIPNMMNGLPRLSYGSEFDFLLWLYYIFEPKTAYILNEIFIHLIAFFSMFFLLKKYVAPPTKEYGLIPVFIGSLYFSLLPFWSGTGASIALLPLATYSILNIKNRKNNIWDWILLILIPLYSSFILVFIFYIAIVGLFFLYETIKNKQLNYYFFFAIFLFTSLYILKNYRLFEAFFLDNGFLSHRIEFNVFYNQTLWETYRLSLVNFLEGHAQHAQTLARYILPLILVGMLLSLFRRRLTIKETMVIWILILISFWIDIWKILLIHKYTLPAIIILSIFLIFRNKKESIIPSLILFIIFLSFAGAAQMYEGFKNIPHYIPLLKSFNIRIHFLLPFAYTILFVYVLKVFFKILPLSSIFSVIFILFQFHDSLSASYFTTNKRKVFTSFESYYAIDIFKQIKDDIKSEDDLNNLKFISYGIEPAVALYNGLYTIDGYCTNYPLSYKHKFKEVQAKQCFSLANRKQIYDNWGSKVYLLCLDSTSSVHTALHETKIKEFPLFASMEGLCNMGTNYIISGVKLKESNFDALQFIHAYHNKDILWHIWLYKLNCSRIKRKSH